jgi:tryptophanyl-tRNA synthetase
VNGKTHQTPTVSIPDPSIADRLNPRGYGEKVTKSVLEQIRPAWLVLSAKSQNADLAKQQAKEARDAFTDQEKRLKPLVDALRPLNLEERQKLVAEAVRAGEKLFADRKTALWEKLQQQLQEREARRGQSKGQSR